MAYGYGNGADEARTLPEYNMTPKAAARPTHISLYNEIMNVRGEYAERFAAIDIQIGKLRSMIDELYQMHRD